MPKIFTCLSNALIKGVPEIESKTVVVIDILRATTCIVNAFELGVMEMRAFANEEECLKMREENFVIAGERNGKKLEGFDLGNSPFDYLDYGVEGRKVAITTTNGTRSLEASKMAKKVVIGAFLNLNAVLETLLRANSDVLLYCSGWKDIPNTEDTLYAGYLARELTKNGFEIEDDASEIALGFQRDSDEDIKNVIQNSAHAKRLMKIGDIQRDLDFASQLDTTEKVPIYKLGRISLEV